MAPGSFRSLRNNNQQLRQVTSIEVIESVMQLPTPQSRHCWCPIRTLALPRDPNSLRVEPAQRALRVFRHRLHTSIECFLHCPRRCWDHCWKGGKVVSPNSPTVPGIAGCQICHLVIVARTLRQIVIRYTGCHVLDLRITKRSRRGALGG